VVVSTLLDDTHPVLEEDIPQVVCQSRDSCDVAFLLDVSLGCNAIVERPCLVPDGFEIAGRGLIVGLGSFRPLTRIVLSAAHAGALARGHLQVDVTAS